MASNHLLILTINGYPFVGFKADLTLKMDIGIEFERFPNFIGNKWAGEMEIGIFEVVSKTISVRGRSGILLWLFKTTKDITDNPARLHLFEGFFAWVKCIR